MELLNFRVSSAPNLSSSTSTSSASPFETYIPSAQLQSTTSYQYRSRPPPPLSLPPVQSAEKPHPLQTPSLSTLELPFTPPNAPSILADGTPRYRQRTPRSSSPRHPPRTPFASTTPTTRIAYPVYPPPNTSSSVASVSSLQSSDSDPELSSAGVVELPKLPMSLSEVDLDRDIIRDDSPRFTYISIRPILKNYGIACLLSVVSAFLSVMISFGASKLQYRVHSPTEKIYYSTRAFAEIVILFYVFGLLFFTVFQFYVFNGVRGLTDSKYISGVGIALSLFVSAPLILRHFEIPYQLYLIDVLLIVVLFCGLTFMIGYFGKEQLLRKQELKSVYQAPTKEEVRKKRDKAIAKQMDPEPEPFMVRISSNLTTAASTSTALALNVGYKLKTHRERILTGVYYTVTEALVSVTALTYGMFLIMVYSSMNNTAKVAWRLILHPLYFEAFMMLPVNYLVSRKMGSAKDNNILYTLSVVHAQSHISTLGRMMFSTLDSLSIVVVSVLLLNIGKFFFRLSAPLRNSLVTRIFNLDVKETSTAARIERQRYIVSAGMQTEMIVENACAIFAGLTMYFFQENKQVFMFPYPKQELSIDIVIYTILVQLAFALVFDLLTLYVAQRFLNLPILETWQDMWNRKYRFFGFLLYGLLTMGVVGIFYMGFKAPRVPFCTSESVCSCVWLKWMHTTCEQYLVDVALT